MSGRHCLGPKHIIKFIHQLKVIMKAILLNLLKVKDSKNNLNEEFINSFSSEQVGLRFQKLLNT